jgi:hypothetical protein
MLREPASWPAVDITKSQEVGNARGNVQGANPAALLKTVLCWMINPLGNLENWASM